MARLWQTETNGQILQLLDRGDVAVGCEPLPTLRIYTALVQLPRLPASLRYRRARRLEVPTGCRVHPAKAEVDAQELSRSVRRHLSRVALQAGCSSAACQQGNGNG